MSKLKDITGKQFGKYTVLKRAENRNGHAMWRCKCECGNIKIVCGTNLLLGKSTSCGCINKNRFIKMNTKHGKRYTRLYEIWVGIKRRCNNKNRADYKNYGARGITVCDEWKNNYLAFEKWALENGYTDELTIDRIDVNGNYEPSNCRWATTKEQANNRTTNHLITINNITLNMTQWANKIGIRRETIKDRLKRGWSVEAAITTPLKK